MGDKRIHDFLKDIYPKVAVIAWLDFELAYYDVVARHASHYAKGNPSPIIIIIIIIYLKLYKFVQTNDYYY